MSLDVLRMLLSVSDVRTQITSICVDLAILDGKDFNADYVEQTFTRVTKHLEDAKAVGKPLDVIEVLHATVLEGKEGLIPLSKMRSLVVEGVIMDGAVHVATYYS